MFFFVFFSIITLYTKNVKLIKNTINSAPITIYVLEGKLNVKKKEKKNHVAEEVGGILTCQSSGFLPRNAAQSYYLKSKKPVAINIRKCSAISSSDPYASLILKCKEQAKNVEFPFVRKVEYAPEQVIYLVNEK